MIYIAGCRPWRTLICGKVFSKKQSIPLSREAFALLARSASAHLVENEGYIRDLVELVCDAPLKEERETPFLKQGDVVLMVHLSFGKISYTMAVV